uniref:Origin recognition complex subunit 3 n=1 Tax=Panstrongylus megistus TaxID=65343 RepID=A0A069DVU5_9HEMI
MLGPESVSKGCFGFCPKSPAGKKKSKAPAPNPLKIFSNEIWYEGYAKIWNEIGTKLETVEDDVTEKLLSDLLSFITSSEATHQIPTAALLTGINLPDHDVLFGHLIKKIKCEKKVSHKVALLSSSDCCSIKHAIERTVSHLMSGQTKLLESPSSDEEDDLDSEDDENIKQKFVKKSACTMRTLLQWYQNENELSPSKKVKFNKEDKGKLIIILKDFEAISSKVLQDFVQILSGYVNMLPLVLVLGVATTLSSISDNLSHSTTSRLCLKSFQSQPSVYFLNNTLNKVFLSPDCPFQLSGKLFKFFTNVFLFYDFSVNRFTQGIKYCVMEHFREGGSIVGLLCCSEDDFEHNIAKMNHNHLEELRRIDSFKKHIERLKDDQLVDALLNDEDATKKEALKLMRQLRQTIKEFYLCLHILHLLVSQLPNAPLGVQLRELYAVAMTKDITRTDDYKECRQLLEFQAKDQLIMKMNKIITLLNENKSLSGNLQGNLRDFKIKLENAGLNQVKRTPVKIEIRKRSQLKQKVVEMGSIGQSEFEQMRTTLLDYLMYDVLNKALQPPSTNDSKWCFWEILILVETEARHRVVPRIRAPIHVALNNPHHYLQCDCCKMESEDQILPTMPDICIAYKLHLESSCLINMYDWLQSFNLIVNPKGTQGVEVDQKIQARFTQAVAELEFLGFIKSSKRKTDHMEKLTWGGPLHSV